MSTGGLDSLVSIAAQIQDRALLLASERGLKDVAQVERDQAKILFERESKQNQQLRRKLLKELRSRHGFELELFRIQEQREDQLDRTKEMEKETERLQKEADALNESWEQSVKDLYAPHKAKLDFYQECLEHRIRHRQRQTKMEQDRIDFLERRTSEMKADEVQLSQDMQKLQHEAQEVDEREEEEDEAVSSLALQIRATLSKRSALRRSVQVTKEAHQKANDEMRKWENECMQNRG